MSQDLPNSGVPPEETMTASDREDHSLRLWPLWCWLCVAVIFSWVASPADPISMILALYYGLLCFWIGRSVYSGWEIPLGVLAFVLSSAGAIGLLLIMIYPERSNNFVLYLYGLISIVMGAWIARRFRPGGSRILLLFSIGFIFLGPLGAGVLAIIAKKTLKISVQSVR